MRTVRLCWVVAIPVVLAACADDSRHGRASASDAKITASSASSASDDLECRADELKQITTADAAAEGGVGKGDIGAPTPEQAMRQFLAWRPEYRPLGSSVPDRFSTDRPPEGFWLIRAGLVGLNSSTRLIARFSLEQYANSNSETAYAVGNNAMCWEQFTAKVGTSS